MNRQLAINTFVGGVVGHVCLTLFKSGNEAQAIVLGISTFIGLINSLVPIRK